VTAPLSRVEFIRRIVNRPTRTPTTGENPYSDEFGILPDAELRRLIAKHSTTVRRGKAGTPKECFTRAEIGRMAECRQDRYLAFCRGEPALTRKELRRLSRLLRQLEAGWLVKIDGWPVMLFKPRVEKPEVRFHVGLTVDRKGKLTPTISIGTQASSAPKSMPRLFSELLIGKR
jgi:hypothetical protein